MNIIKVLLSMVISILMLMPTSSFITNVVAKKNTADVAVIMYHSVNENAFGEYIITPFELEEDLKYLFKNGYQSVTMKEILGFEAGVIDSLPEKSVLITFDDGHWNNITTVQPLLEKYDFTAVMFIVGKYCDFEEKNISENLPRNNSYSYLTWEDVKTASDSGVWEVGSHTYALHNSYPRRGLKQMTGESEEEYREVLRNDFSLINEKIKSATGKSPIGFAYPFGYYSNIAKEELIKSGVKMIFTCEEGIARFTQNAGKNQNLFIKRLLRLRSQSLKDILF